MDDPVVRGALVGWRQSQSEHGAVLRLQVARSAADVRDRSWDKVEIALNERQLRSFARDLVRAAHERDLRLFARRPLWERMQEKLTALFG
jgi:hypothetical protein